MIEAVVFDLAEVLLRGLFGVEERIASITKADSEEVFTQLKGKSLSALFKGEKSEVEYWQDVRGKSNWNVSIEELKEAIRKNFGEVEGTRNIIKKVGKEYKTGLISDHAEEWVKYCEARFSYHELFDEIVYSFEDEVFALKGEGKPFKVMLERLEMEPEQCLFIDDLEQNVLMAREIGMETIQFESVEQLELDLLHKLEKSSRR